MVRATRGRDALELCRRARPEVPADLLSPDTPAARVLVEEILSMPRETRPTHSRLAHGRSAGTRGSWPHWRRVRPVIAVIGSAAIAAGAAVAVVELSNSGPPAGPTVTAGGPRAALVDITRIAETSNTAVGRSGRAHVVFELQSGTPFAQQGTNDVAWSGHDIEMKVHIEAHDGHPASDAWTRTVDGRFYSYVGPKGGPRHWVGNTGAGPARGGQLFDADPRTLLPILDPSARFTHAGADRINGVPVRHLHATAVDHLPALGLGLEPDSGNTAVTSLDLWVGPDDVVQRMDIGLRRTDTKTGDQHVGQPAASASHDSTYSVTFFDLGAPITIDAPPNPVEAGK